MPAHIVRQTVGRQQWRNQKQKSPRRQQRRFHELPTKDRLRRYRQRHQKNRLAVPEQVGVADDKVAEQQQHEQKSGQKKKQPLDQERAQSREGSPKPQALAEQPQS